MLAHDGCAGCAGCPARGSMAAALQNGTPKFGGRKMKVYATSFFVTVVVLIGSLSSTSLQADPPGKKPDAGIPWCLQRPPTAVVKGKLTFSRRRPKQPIVVYLVRDEAPLPFEAPPPREISQAGAKFDPSFLVVVVGQTVVFNNDEIKDISHNVYGLGSDAFDLGIFSRKTKLERTFKTPGEVNIHCSIHKYMNGKIFVAPNPAFDVVEATEDTFEIKGVSAGSYTLRTYQKVKRFNDLEVKITIKADQTLTADLEMKR